MGYVDHKFIGIISARLKNFTKKSNTLYNFRCPICGDSEKNSYKARGYLFPSEDKSTFIFKCHNCGDTRPLASLIRYLDHEVYRKYLLEGFKDEKDNRFVVKGKQQKKKKKIDKDVDYFEKTLDAQRVDKLPANHKVFLFLEKRKIPKESHSRLYYIHNDRNLERIHPKYKNRIIGQHDRLILPFYDRDRRAVGLAARALDPVVQPRYLAFRLDDTVPMLYGIENIKRNARKPVTVVEGPIDSLFLDNCIAVAGADFAKLEKEIRRDKCILVFDNEPRNKEIVKRMKKMIDAGYKVCVWPETIEEKDINDMVLAGKSPSEIQDVINRNTFSGLKAVANLNSWKRCSI
jgi:hypothetical protein